MRESKASWEGVLRDLQRRGLVAPKLTIADGHLGIWAALAEIYPESEEARCWNHRIVNVHRNVPGVLRDINKIVSDKKTHKILGVHIVGPGATDLISEGMLAMEMGALADDLALTIHPHPTLGEAMMEAGAHALGHAIHTVNR